MKNTYKEMYEILLSNSGFYYYDRNNTKFNSEGTCFTLLPEKGTGHYWFFTCENLFSISVQDFILSEDLSLEWIQNRYLSISCNASLPCNNPDCSQLHNACINWEVQCSTLNKNFFRKNIPTLRTDITISAEYFVKYLHIKSSIQYEKLRNAFSCINGIKNFPELLLLFSQIRNCRFTGISAKLFFESKVMEAVSLIIQKSKEGTCTCDIKRLAPCDIESIAAVTEYIDNHYALEITLNTLSKIACMGMTKLKHTFKTVHKCTVSDYILNKRISHARYLLENTDLNINQISKIIGYKKSGSFSVTFKKNSGLLPNEYRKLTGYRL